MLWKGGEKWTETTAYTDLSTNRQRQIQPYGTRLESTERTGLGTANSHRRHAQPTTLIISLSFPRPIPTRYSKPPARHPVHTLPNGLRNQPRKTSNRLHICNDHLRVHVFPLFVPVEYPTFLSLSSYFFYLCVHKLSKHQAAFSRRIQTDTLMSARSSKNVSHSVLSTSQHVMSVRHCSQSVSRYTTQHGTGK
jgi:hypothetical protein